MAVYADYEFYTTQYLGTAISEAAYDALALQASAEIDRLTFGRVAPIVTAGEDADLIERIGMATCAVAETLQAQAGSGADGITSERVGSHSVTYAAPTSHQREITLAAGRWLANTGLLYRGFAAGEYSGTL